MIVKNLEMSRIFLYCENEEKKKAFQKTTNINKYTLQFKSLGSVRFLMFFSLPAFIWSKMW